MVGDFRLSLAVSAPLRHIPYAAVVNAYWSPYADIAYPVPDLPMTRMLGVSLAQKLFDLARPIAFALHARPLNQVRRRYGLPPLGHDLRTVYTWGDYTLYADVPELVPMRPLPANHRHLGPPLWSARMPLPDWWGRLPEDKPVVLLTLGSSGRADLVADGLIRPVRTADHRHRRHRGQNRPCRCARQRLRGGLSAAGCRYPALTLISNGGSLTTYQALACGVPVLGICSNMDQLLNMNAIERLGAGITLRAAGLTSAGLSEAATAMLDNLSYTQVASRFGQAIAQVDAGQRFREIVAEIVRETQGAVDTLIA